MPFRFIPTTLVKMILSKAFLSPLLILLRNVSIQLIHHAATEQHFYPLQ